MKTLAATLLILLSACPAAEPTPCDEYDANGIECNYDPNTGDLSYWDENCRGANGEVGCWIWPTE
jgi:hypothetical protein